VARPKVVHEAITYYSPEEPAGRVVKDAELQGTGRAWTLGEYHHPVYPSPLNVRVGDAGIKAWMVIRSLKAAQGDKERVLSHYGPSLQREDLDVAIWFYEQAREAIDQRLSEEVGAA
jgi:hypothetical protein